MRRPSAGGLTPDMSRSSTTLPRQSRRPLVLAPAVVADLQRVEAARRGRSRCHRRRWYRAPTGRDRAAGRPCMPRRDGVPPCSTSSTVSSGSGEPWCHALQPWFDDAIDVLAPDAAQHALRQRLAAVRDLQRAGASTSARPGFGRLLAGRASGSCTRGPGRDRVCRIAVWCGRKGLQAGGARRRRVRSPLRARGAQRRSRPHEHRVHRAGYSPARRSTTGVSRRAWRRIRPSAEYTVTVRPLERMERAPLVRRRFKRAWDDLKDRAADVLAMLRRPMPRPPPRRSGDVAR